MTMRRDCYTQPYNIPRLFIENTRAVTSDEYLILNLAEKKAILTEDKKLGRLGKIFSKTLYGVLLDEIIDLVSQKVVKDFVVVIPPNYRRGLYVPRTSKITPIPMEGLRVVLEICEGVEVDKEETIGYIVTKKGEIRHIRSHISGIISYIYSDPASTLDKYIVFISPKKEVEVVEVQ